MSRLEAWFHHLANLLVGGTGAAYAWTLYFCQPEDEFALVNHPWQPGLHHAHLWTAPLLVFSAGVLWKQHALRRLRQPGGGRKSSRLGMLSTLWPMVLSGALIQTAVEPAWRQTWLIVHLASSALWIGASLGHQLRRRPAD